MAPDRASPVQLEMSQPGRDPDQRRPAAVHGVGEARAVRRGAKPDLSHDARTPVSRELQRTATSPGDTASLQPLPAREPRKVLQVAGVVTATHGLPWLQ